MKKKRKKEIKASIKRLRKLVLMLIAKTSCDVLSEVNDELNRNKKL